MRPFTYPARRHRRRERPEPSRDYRRFKRTLRREFGGQCVYCRLPDFLKGSDSFHVDHYRPQRQFPQLAVTYANLFYSCPACNQRKGDFWPTPADVRQERVVLNPCDHAMGRHLAYFGPRVRATTTQGRWTAELLAVNDDRSIEARRIYAAMIEGARAKIRELRSRLGALKRALTRSAGAGRAKNEASQAALRDGLLQYELHLRRLECRDPSLFSDAA